MRMATHAVNGALYVGTLIYFFVALPSENKGRAILIFAIGAPIFYLAGLAVQRRISGRHSEPSSQQQVSR